MNTILRRKISARWYETSLPGVLVEIRDGSIVAATFRAERAKRNQAWLARVRLAHVR